MAEPKADTPQEKTEEKKSSPGTLAEKELDKVTGGSIITKANKRMEKAGVTPPIVE